MPLAPWSRGKFVSSIMRERSSSTPLVSPSCWGSPPPPFPFHHSLFFFRFRPRSLLRSRIRFLALILSFSLSWSCSRSLSFILPTSSSLSSTRSVPVLIHLFIYRLIYSFSIKFAWYFFICLSARVLPSLNIPSCLFCIANSAFHLTIIIILSVFPFFCKGQGKFICVRICAKSNGSSS